MALLFTSVTLYLCEALLFFLFFSGFWAVIRRICRLRWVQHDDDWKVFLPQVTESYLQRFMAFQILFLAIWSICFKAVLKTSLDPALAHYLLARGGSLGIAIPAEVVILFILLIGTVKFWTKAAMWAKVRTETPRDKAK